MSEDKSDLTGISEIAKAIPDKSWNRMVKTACTTFENLLSPITQTTGGLGRLIKAKFDNLVDGEKVLVTETFSKANEKVEKSGKEPGATQNLNVIIRVIEESSRQTDQKIRDLWSNLLANEIIDGTVHPEVVSILSRLSSSDAKVLAEIDNMNVGKKEIRHLALEAFASAFSVNIFIQKEKPKETFSEKLLESLNLIKRIDNYWELTAIGIGFIESVSEPKERM